MGGTRARGQGTLLSGTTHGSSTEASPSPSVLPGHIPVLATKSLLGGKRNLHAVGVQGPDTRLASTRTFFLLKHLLFQVRTNNCRTEPSRLLQTRCSARLNPDCRLVDSLKPLDTHQSAVKIRSRDKPRPDSGRWRTSASGISWFYTNPTPALDRTPVASLTVAAAAEGVGAYVCVGRLVSVRPGPADAYQPVKPVLFPENNTTRSFFGIINN